MSDAVEILEFPKAENIYMIAGWRQWADAGSTSSGLPKYLIEQTKARKIGTIQSEGFYLFQIPGTHDLVRPVVKFNQGYPESLEVQQNDLYYAEINQNGLLIFLGDEPQLDIERYTQALLHIVQELGVKRIIGLGGVYGELPYNKDRVISSIYSLQELKDELQDMSVNLSEYHGGASVGSYICSRAGKQGIEYVSFYAFVPAYDFSNVSQVANSIRIENDFSAWLGIMQRINHMLKLDLDLSDLEKRSKELIELFDSKIDELDEEAPQLGVREYLDRLSEEFETTPFTPLDDVWEEELRRLFGQTDPDDFQDGDTD
ncbi:MAG: PAC2 family protein [Chloroflexota bacterium]|nr:MAG: PAC2 family protein [Chloroflexota bacterium]